MTFAADHFLETFERRRRGTASREELVELEAHAQACASCALELSLMNDLAIGRAEPDQDFFADERAVTATLRKLEAPPLKPRRIGWVLPVSALFIAGAAAATGGVLLQRTEPARAPAASSGPPVSGAAPSRGARASIAEPPASPALAPETEQPQSAGNAADGSFAEAAKPASAEPETAAQLFAKANQLRRQGKDALATDQYRELQRRFAGSAEARQALVTLGFLLLDRSRPAEALQQFELYLKRGGAASEDALVGQALAQQRLGRADDERRTLAALVSRYPASANAARAKKRLAELE